MDFAKWMAVVRRNTDLIYGKTPEQMGIVQALHREFEDGTPPFNAMLWAQDDAARKAQDRLVMPKGVIY